MNDIKFDHFSKKMDTLFKKEKLDDLSCFLERDTFDEVPLFSRYKNISFLTSLTAHERNTVLIKYALLHIDRIFQFAAQQLNEDSFSRYFAMISILDWDEYTPQHGQILPCFWITSKSTEILPYIQLSPGYSKEAEEIEFCLRDIGEQNRFMVLDYAKLPEPGDIFRVFVVHRNKVIKLNLNPTS